jgi:hypothetical protein
VSVYTGWTIVLSQSPKKYLPLDQARWKEKAVRGFYFGGVDIRRWFVISMLLFFNVTIIGCLLLLALGRIAP